MLDRVPQIDRDNVLVLSLYFAVINTSMAPVRFCLAMTGNITRGDLKGTLVTMTIAASLNLTMTVRRMFDQQVHDLKRSGHKTKSVKGDVDVVWSYFSYFI